MQFVVLNEQEKFRIKVMDAHRQMSGRNVRYLCRLFSIGKSTFYRWRAQYDPKRITTIKVKSRKPKTLKIIDWSAVIEICDWKRNNPKKSHYYLYQLWKSQDRVPPCSPKTIYNWWKRRGLIVNRHRRKRRNIRLFNRASVPGELVQVDVKFVDGRKTFQYTAIDVVSKWRVIKAYNKLNQDNSIDFLHLFLKKARQKGLKTIRIQTDNGLEFQSMFTNYLKSLDILHQYTWIHTPDQNGVVERSHRTDEEEFYQETDTKNLSLEELNVKLEEWIEYYNTKRLHFSLNFATPSEYLEKHQVSQM